MPLQRYTIKTDKSETESETKNLKLLHALKMDDPLLVIPLSSMRLEPAESTSQLGAYVTS